MSFAWPVALLGLLLVPAIAALYVWTLHRRRRYTLRYSSVGLVSVAASRGAAWRRHLPAALYLLAIAALFVALARPKAPLVAPEASGTVILSIDVSGSMRTADIRPSRIDAAKAAVREFVAKEPKGVKIGVVAFSDSAVLITPPTDNRQQVLGAVNYLGLGRGTNIGDGLQVALQAILDPYGGDTAPAPPVPPSGSIRVGPTPTPLPLLSLPPLADPSTAIIVLLSDGASTTGPAPLTIADEVAQAKIKTYTVGLGVVQSAQQQQLNGFGFPGFGRTMELDEATLKGIADKTGGEYFSAQNAGQLHQVYAQLAKNSHLVTAKTELTFLAAAIAALFMVAAAVSSFVFGTRLP